MAVGLGRFHASETFHPGRNRTRAANTHCLAFVGLLAWRGGGRVSIYAAQL